MLVIYIYIYIRSNSYSNYRAMYIPITYTIITQNRVENVSQHKFLRIPKKQTINYNPIVQYRYPSCVNTIVNSYSYIVIIILYVKIIIYYFILII